MIFKEIYEMSLKYWESSIDISDAKIIDETNGFHSLNLSNSWNKAEGKVINDWDDLMVWIIFQELHNIAKENFIKGEFTLKLNEIKEARVEKRCFEALHNEGYGDMLAEYIKNN